jgi:hypothetical protein
MGHAYNFREERAGAEGPKGPGPKVLSHLKVVKGKNGGHVVTHVFEYNPGPGASHPDEEYPFGAGEGAKVLAHIAKHVGIKASGAAAEPRAGGNALE